MVKAIKLVKTYLGSKKLQTSLNIAASQKVRQNNSEAASPPPPTHTQKSHLQHILYYDSYCPFLFDWLPWTEYPNYATVELRKYNY